MPKGHYDRSFIRKGSQGATVNTPAQYLPDSDFARLLARVEALEQRLEKANIDYFGQGYVPPSI